MWTKSAIAALAALLFSALARGLPAETFFVGDPGVKLIAARHAIDHPSEPFAIPLPVVAGKRLPFVEPFFVVHDDHAHAVTSELFPLVSAPFIALFGVRGAYILPAIGFVLTLAGSLWMARALAPQKPAAGVLIATTLGTPLLFYGFEFWEHAPAAGAAALATALMLRHRTFVAGLLFGLAVLLRPEAACYVAAVVTATAVLPSRPRGRAFAIGAIGIGVVVTPLLIYSLAHFGSVLPPHISSHSALFTRDWAATRLAIASRWFVPQRSDIASWWGVVLIVVPLAAVATRPYREGHSFLIAVISIDIALVVFSAPNDGGGQWGPRYLLLAYVPAAILMADTIEALSTTRAIAKVKAASAVMIVILVAGGVWAQRDGYRRLRNTKMIYGRVLEFVRREAPVGAAVVTDLWWLDQVAAAATAGRPFMFVADVNGERVMRALAETPVERVTVFRSFEESPAGDTWITASCYAVQHNATIPERSLVATALERRPGCP